jgi:hypothetical protein
MASSSAGGLPKKSKWGTSDKDMERYVDFQFRRLDYLLWDPVTLFRRIFIKENPMMKIFLCHIKMLAMERALIFSCSVMGSVLACALLFDGGAGSTQSQPLVVVNETNATAELPWYQQFELDSDGELVDTRQGVETTTAAPTNPFAPEKIFRQIIISVVSIVIGMVPMLVTVLCFFRGQYHEKMTEERKLKIVRRWIMKRWCGYIFAGTWLLFCFFFLWQFAMSRPLDIQQDFTVSSILSLTIKLILKPFGAIFLVTGVVVIFRSSTWLDDFVTHIPAGFLHFDMYTATSREDMAMQQAAALGAGYDLDAEMFGDIFVQ